MGVFWRLWLGICFITCYYANVSKKSGKKRTSKPTRDQALAAKRTPIKLRPREKWLDAAAARDAAREHESLTRSLLTLGVRHDILAYILGMRTLLIGLRDLAEAITTTPPEQQSALVRDALEDRERVERALTEMGVPVSPVDDLRTPVGVGRAVALQFGAELERAHLYVLDTSAFFALIDVADRLTLDDTANLDWRGTGMENGFILLPETLYVQDDEDGIGNMVALSWAQGRSVKDPESLRTTSWSQTYGDDSDDTWTSVLEAAEEQSVALPRLAYGGSAWALTPTGSDPVDLVPSGMPLVDHEDGVIASSGDGTLVPCMALAAVNMMREGVLVESRVFTERGTEVHSMTLADPARLPARG